MRRTIATIRSAGRAIAGFLGIPMLTVGCLWQPVAAQEARTPSVDPAAFETILAKHQDLTYPQWRAALGEQPPGPASLSFDPTKQKFFDQIQGKLKLTDEELAVFRRTGLVAIDQRLRYSFASAYYQIYTSDLPVLVTTDSILHALHRSYDELLAEVETTWFAVSLNEILADCHSELERMRLARPDPALGESLRDVDLFLTVARNLFAGAGAPAGLDSHWGGDLWKGELRIRSVYGQDDEVLTRLKDIQSGVIQVPFRDEPTRIYGGMRFVDYSQFRPRGHYTRSPDLRRYFRAMIWMGRADCGWNVLPSRTPGVAGDSDRELRDAALLSQLIASSGGLGRLRAIDNLLTLLVGHSDNLGVFSLADLLKRCEIKEGGGLADPRALARLKKALEDGRFAQQRIRSQAVISDPEDPYKVPPPSTFLMFGQRFALDSFILSHVVFDSIIFQDRKQKRMMPRGLDVMAALGNDEAASLLDDEVKRWNYGANLLATREFVGQLGPEFWRENLYNGWLDALRTLDDDLSREENAPQAMRTAAWRRKQLQTQLASWAELRHDNVLHAKQSYTGVPACEYPDGYVEPYPRFYASLRSFAEETLRRLVSTDYGSKDPRVSRVLADVKARQLDHLRTMARILGRLEVVARKELRAEPLTAEERGFLERTIDQRGTVRWGSGRRPRYDGWYCDLLYKASEGSTIPVNDPRSLDWGPTVVDIHTDPESQSVLEAGVGDVNLCVIAIDNRGDKAVYVGPIFSYHEFRQPAEGRLTDERWQTMIVNDGLLSPPEWTRVFRARPRIQTGR
jgi:hypothetical protein